MKKILVIEDRAETRNLFLECLEAEGFYTIGAENGLVGIEKVQKELPDLVVCEIMIPKLDGYGVLTKLRQDPVSATIPFIFVTSRVNWADFRKGMELGADDYLTKPFTVDELLDKLLKAIATCLSKRTALQQRFAATTSRQALEQSFFPSVPQLQEVFEYIEANYHRTMTVKEVAQKFNYTATYLTNLSRKLTGKSLYKWIVLRRLEQACYLLLTTNLSVEQIATQVGYCSPVPFFRLFRLEYEITPQVWRSQHRSNA